jgi:competence protein ComEC
MKVFNRDIILLTVFSSFMIGVFVRSFIRIPLWVFVALLLWVFVVYLGSKRRDILMLVLIGLMTFSIGVARFEIDELKRNDSVLDLYVGEEIIFSGVVTEEPDVRERQQRLIVTLESVEGSEFDNLRMLVTTDLYPRFSYGDLIEVEAKIEKPENFVTDSGREFDYIQFLGKDRIFYTASFADVSLIDSGHGSWLRRQLFVFKGKFLNASNRIIPEPESALLGGILLGVKQSLGSDLQQAFVDTGTVHIIVLSGYNVTIVSDSIVKFFTYIFSQTVGLALGGFSIVLFALITGAGATIVRASLMALLAVLARATGRTTEITRLLALAGILMVMHNPYILAFDISFQLSFLATLGLIYISPLVEKWFQWVPTFLNFREIVAATIATQIAVLPYLLFRIGTLSIISPIANVLVLPLVPPAMLFGFLAGAFEMISSVIAAPFAWVAYLLLTMKIKIVELLSIPSWAAVSLPGFSIIFVILGYSLISFWLVLHYSNTKPSKKQITTTMNKGKNKKLNNNQGTENLGEKKKPDTSGVCDLPPQKAWPKHKG